MAAVNEVLQSINVYPNPVKDHITVQCGAGAQITVHDVMGRVVYRGRSKGNVHTIDMRRAVQGVYFVQVKRGGEVVVRKVVKE